MAEKILKEQEEQEQREQQQEQQQTQEQQEQQRIKKIVNELKEEASFFLLYDEYRYQVLGYEPHGFESGYTLIDYMLETGMNKYLYYIVKAYVDVLSLNPEEVKEKIAKLIEELKGMEEDFEDKLFYAALLTHFIYKPRDTITKFLKLYYYYKLLSELEKADIALATYYSNILDVLKAIFDEEELYTNMPELMRDLHNYDIQVQEIMAELGLNEENLKEMKNILLNEISTVLTTEFNKKFIKKIKEMHGGKLGAESLLEICKKLEKLIALDEDDFIQMEKIKRIKIREEIPGDSYLKEELKAAIEDYLKAVNYFYSLFSLARYYTTYPQLNIKLVTIFWETLDDYWEEINIVREGIFKYLTKQ